MSEGWMFVLVRNFFSLMRPPFVSFATERMAARMSSWVTGGLCVFSAEWLLEAFGVAGRCWILDAGFWMFDAALFFMSQIPLDAAAGKGKENREKLTTKQLCHKAITIC